MMDFLISMLRTLFFSLDKVVFGLIDDVYGLLLQLTRTSIFDQDAIHEFSKRVYALVGIFMLFKVSVSIINYILNPDDFTDKEKGFGSIIKHVILSLVMVVLVPYIFNEAYDLQSIILRENTIMNLVFGSPSGDVPRAANSSYSESAGKKIQFTLLYAFAHPNYDDFANDTTTFDLIDCKETYDTDENGQYKFRLKPVFGTNNQSGALSSYIYELRPTCWGVYNAENDSYEASGANGTLLQAFDSIDASIAYQNYAQGVAQQSFTLFFRKEAILAKIDDGRYLIDYKFGISTAIGVGTLYLFLLFCIDIAVRSIKLGFLQMIAPIPIISYCDPKSGKDGMFKKWMDMSVKTYLELFIRLFALYFGIYIITLVGAFKDIVTGEIVDNKLVMVFMILGVLIFIKKLPDIIKDVFNVKGDGKFQLNPLKKIEDEAIGGKRITGFAAGTAGGIVGAVTGAGALRGITGGLSGALGNKGLVDTWKNTKDLNAKYRTANLADRNAFSRAAGRLHSGFSEALGTGGELAKIERQEAEINRQIEQHKANKERIEARIAPTRTTIARNQDTVDKIKAMQDRAVSRVKQGVGAAGTNYQDMIRQAAGVKASTAISGSVTVNGHTYSWANETQRGAEAARIEQDAERYANTAGRDAYIDHAIGHAGWDATFDNFRTDYTASAGVSGHTVQNTAADLDAQSGTINTANTTARNSISAQERQIQDIDDEIKHANDELRNITDNKKRYESYRVK